MLHALENERLQLHKIGAKKGLLHKQTLKQSRALDHLIVAFMKKERNK